MEVLMNEAWTGIEALSRSRAKLYFDYPSRIRSYKWWWFFGILTVWGTFGIMLIVWAIISKKKINKECPRDQEMEAEYARVADELEAEALMASSFGEDDLTRETDVVWGPDIHTYDKFCPYRSRKGADDDRYRGNQRAILVILYGDNRIMSAQTTYAIETGESHNILTKEFFYKDIVGVKTSLTEFSLDTTGGYSIKVPLALSDQKKEEFLKKNVGKEFLEESGDMDLANAAVRNVRSMLQDKEG